MKKNYALLLTALLLLTGINHARAGWPIGKYRHIFTPSVTFYHASDQWDINGNRVKGGPGSGFNSLSLGLFAGVGISRRADIYVSLPISFQSSRIGGQRQPTSSGLGDATLGLSYNLAHFKYKRFLSVQGTVIAPLYSVQTTGNPLGYGTLGLEGKLMLCGQFIDQSYFNLEAGYRRYFDDKGPNQIVYIATLGTPLDKRKKNQLSADIGGVTSYSANRTLVSVNPNLVYDGFYVKGSVNYGHKFTNRFSVFGSVFHNFIGRNAPVGSGGAVFAIYKF